MSQQSNIPKAYIITDPDCEAAVLAFAGSHAKAKTIGFKAHIGMCSSEWVDLRCRRYPEADQYAAEYNQRTIDGESINDDRIMYELCWFPIDGSNEQCVNCERYEWENIAASRIPEGSEICVDCRGRQ